MTGAGQPGGIGAAICRAFAEQGSNIFFTTNSAFDARYHFGSSTEMFSKRFTEQLQDLGVNAGCMDIDLAEKDAFQRVLDAAWCFLRTTDVLVNNAALSAPDGYERLTTDLLDSHYFVNVRAALMLSVGFARRFAKTNGGRIINLTSGQDLGPMPGELSYAMSKGAIAAFTRTLAAEVGRKGITVNAVDPGPTDTGWMSSEIKQKLADKNAFGRVGEPRDAALLVVFLASSAGGWITGQVIHSRGIETSRPLNEESA